MYQQLGDDVQHAAAALWQATVSGDESGLRRAMRRARRMHPEAAFDAWTAEKMELLAAIAQAIDESGGTTPASRALLLHLARPAGLGGRVM
jgi:ABC-type branched-subunit amino acid transport system substrate-binding protein